MVLEIQPAFQWQLTFCVLWNRFLPREHLLKCISVVTELPSDEVDGGKFGILMKARKPESASFNRSSRLLEQ